VLHKIENRDPPQRATAAKAGFIESQDFETKRRLTINNLMDCRASLAAGSGLTPASWATAGGCDYADDRIIVRFPSPTRFGLPDWTMHRYNLSAEIPDFMDAFTAPLFNPTALLPQEPRLANSWPQNKDHKIKFAASYPSVSL
jgi:hypothetical protein